MLVAAFSAASCLGTKPSAQLSTTPTPDQFYWPGKPTEHSRLSRFGTTCEPLMENRGAALLTWYLAGFRVKTSASPETAQDLTARARDSGEKWPGSLAKYDPASHSLKTAQLSLLADSIQCSPTLPRSGLIFDGECWELPMLAPNIVETDCGFLPTPRASMSTHGIAWCRAQTGDHRHNLEDFLAWRYLETGGSVISGLNVSPSYCEFLMMWPVGWSDLRPLATARCPYVEHAHGSFSHNPFECWKSFYAD